MKEYSRDKRSPVSSGPSVSRSMSSNKSKNTVPELRLRRALRDEGLSGYRLHRKDVPGKPDITYIGKKLAIFVNGCFWHRCPFCKLPLPKSNADFWTDKFRKNIERDISKKELLEAEGWFVLTVWECEIKKDISEVVSRIKTKLSQSEMESIYPNDCR